MRAVVLTFGDGARRVVRWALAAVGGIGLAGLIAAAVPTEQRDRLPAA